MFRIVLNINGIRFYSEIFDTREAAEQMTEKVMFNTSAGTYVEALEENYYGDWIVV